MNQERIGQFIKNIRKQNHLTQEEFAEKLKVSFQAVSKWENSKSIPDIAILKQISKEYNVSIDDLLEGEYSKKQKNKKIIFFLLLVIIFFSSIYCILIIKNKNQGSFEFKTISSRCENFTISGSLSYNKNKSAIYITNINYCGGDDKTIYDEIECTLYEFNEKTQKIISNYNDKNSTTLDNFLKNITFTIDNYTSVCTNYSEDSLRLVINAKKDNKITTYEIPLSINDEC